MNLIAENLRYYGQQYEVSILAYVVMPNHIHMILDFKRGSDRIAFMRDFKKYTSTKIRKEIELHEPEMLKKYSIQRVNRNSRYGKIDLTNCL
ncbi:MAG: transposase [Chitinophagales bacterium]|nr:transposase [Chitinophagales bacterium]